MSRETAFNLQRPVLEESFLKFHPQPQASHKLIVKARARNVKDNPELCLRHPSYCGTIKGCSRSRRM